MRTWNAVVSATLVTAIVMGCGRSARINPTAPSDEGGLRSAPQSVQPDREGPNRLLWGFWSVTVSEDRTRAEIVPVRTAAMHLNVVRLLEVTPCKTCLAIGNIHMVEPNVLEADLTLTHPYPGLLKFTGFDVRGIFIAQTDFTFPVSGRKIAWGDDVPRMLDPDGYTSLFNPTEYPPTFPAALGYIPGKYATGGDLTATLNPFVAYRRYAPRCMFEAGGSEARTIRLYAPSGPIHFGYAVDACWQLVENVVDPLADFPPDANCLEAYRVSVDLPYNVNSSWMSQNPINVEVFDHQGLETVSTVTVESPDLFSGETALTLSTQTGEDSWLFSGFITNATAADQGTYPLLVKVTDKESDQNLGTIHAWGAGLARVNAGWARTWGGSQDDEAFAVAVDGSGNTYVTGWFRDTVDFDPGSAVDNHTTTEYPEMADAFLSKFDSSGVFQWARTWGGSHVEAGYGVTVDGSGNVYVTGSFWNTVDFEPGSGEDNHTSNGYGDVFLSEFDPSGAFIWARTWGGTDDDWGSGVAVDGSGNLYVTGYFSVTVDFDPGSGVDDHTSNGSIDAFLSKFDPSGAFQWALTWGGKWGDRARGVAVDGLDNLYVTGWFEGAADFDPGDGVDERTSNGFWQGDAFLSKFDSSGAFQWVRIWGGVWEDCALGIALDASGNVHVTGSFQDTVDFDPGNGVDNHISNGYNDVFLSQFDSSGGFQWARSWGGSDRDAGEGVALDGTGNISVTGHFNGSVDFDPGSGIDTHSSKGGRDVFLSRFDPSGIFTWARTWGASVDDYGNSVVVDASANAYVTGYFCDTVDFDPGTGVDNHTSNGHEDAFLSKFPPDGNW